MLGWLTKCSACAHALTFFEAVLCTPCKERLKLCADQHIFSHAQELTALHVLYAQAAYPVLKAWKKKGGWWWDRYILSKQHISFVQRLLDQETKWDVVVPIPLSQHRKVRLHASPSYKIAHWVARYGTTSALAVCDSLIKVPFTGQQAQKDAFLRRIEMPIFTKKGSARLFGKNILLVDDFYTTGATLTAAAQCLKYYGAAQVQGFVVCSMAKSPQQGY